VILEAEFYQDSFVYIGKNLPFMASRAMLGCIMTWGDPVPDKTYV